LKDSSEDAEISAPMELIEILMKLRGEQAAAVNG
jgi:hypothetical protein